MAELFSDKQQITARALFVGQRLELKEFEKQNRLASTPLIVAAGAEGCAVLLRYGVVVLFGLSGEE